MLSTVVELMTRPRPSDLSITSVNRYIYAQVSSQRLPGATHRVDTVCYSSRDQTPGRTVTMPQPEQTRAFNATNSPTHLRGISCVTTSILNEGGNKYLSFLVHLPLVIHMLNLRNSRPTFTKFGASVTQPGATSSQSDHHTDALCALTVTHARTHSCKMK